jgi:hypothetical protein
MLDGKKGLGRVVIGLSILVFGFGQAYSVAQTTASATTYTTIEMDNPAILYSPFNWAVTSHGAKTINSGAYFKVFFSGTSCQLATNTSEDAGAGLFPQFLVRIDGGSFTRYELSPGNPVFTVASGRANHKHLLEVLVKSTSEFVNRWTPQQTAVNFSAIQFDSGATVTAPARKPYNVLIYGDSITEAIRVNGFGSNIKETDQNDASQGYGWYLSQVLPVEVGVVAFGATGINKAGSGGVPGLINSYPYLWAGQPRSFSNPAPDLIIYNEGTGDAELNSDITASYTAIVKAHEQLAPNAEQLLLRPFNGAFSSQIQAIAANDKTGNVSFGDTTGFIDFSTDLCDNNHPWGSVHVGKLAPKLIQFIYPLLR